MLLIGVSRNYDNFWLSFTALDGRVLGISYMDSSKQLNITKDGTVIKSFS